MRKQRNPVQQTRKTGGVVAYLRPKSVGQLKLSHGCLARRITNNRLSCLPAWDAEAPDGLHTAAVVLALVDLPTCMTG